ncbi:MAG: nucleotide exchange factor GrpE [Deltaproteobacteria bacterium CG11_big_fil_rev_8_21_14_0_20_49_13]|nr:MAG: nucleotide exchange factor GrpE [Deltaproteobacteria bacterium CG11_big_fil_rev_8_21_14_0_20_49_13]
MKNKVEQLKEMMKKKKEAEEKGSGVQGIGSGEKQDPDNAEPLANTDELSNQIKAAEDEAKEHHDKLLRVMAEFENFKKRIEREKMEQAKYANQSLLHDLLPVMDDFDRVLEHIPKDPSPEIAGIADGVKIIQNHFIVALSKHGLVTLDSEPGQTFDPNFHDAVANIGSEQPEGTLAMVHRKGWKLHDRVIRPATVSVSKGKE